MHRRTFGAICLALGFVACTARQEGLRLGTSSVGSAFYGLAVAISEMAYRHAGLNLTVQPVGGSVPNMFGIDMERLDLAVVNSYAAYLAYNRQTPFTRAVDVRLVIQGQKSHRQFLVRRGSGIESPVDFPGKTIIADRPSNPEMRAIMDAIVDVYRLPPDKIRIISTSTSSEAMRALEVGSVDAVLLPFSAGSALAQNALNHELAFFLNIPTALRDAVVARLPPAVGGFTLAAGTFAGQLAEVHTFAVNSYLVARADVDAAMVAAIAGVLFRHHEELVDFQKSGREWTLERTLEPAPLPYHAGVVELLRDMGAWSDELEARQTMLLRDRRL